MSRPVRWLNPPRTVWPVILVALCVRLAPIPLIARLAPDVQAAGFASDGTDFYARLGHSLAASHEFALHPGHPTAGHVPIYPALLALLEIAGRPGPLALIVAQALLGALCLVLLFTWVRRIADPTAALIALILATILPDFAVYSYLNMSENLFMVLMLATLCVGHTALQSGKVLRWALTGVLVGLMALTREFGATLLLPLAAAAWGHFGIRGAAPRAGIMALASCLIILPWTLRNYRLFGELIPLTDKGAVNVYVGTLKGTHHPSDPRRNWALEDPSQQAVDRDLQTALAASGSFGERNRLYLRAAWSNLSTDPWGQIVYLARKAGFFWQPNVGRRHGGRIGHELLLGASEVLYWLCVLAAASVVFFRRRLDRRVLLPGLLAAWTFLFHLVVGEAESRYHFNLLPAVFAFAGMSLAAALLFLNPAAPQSPVRSLTG